MPPLEQPARDAFIEIGEHGDEDEKQRLHDLMNAELCAAELTARTSHEHPDMPWDFHVDMARQVWDDVRHAEVCDRLMATELDCHWGDYPVGFAAFRSSYARDLRGRLALSNGGEKPRDGTLARVFDYLRADESRARADERPLGDAPTRPRTPLCPRAASCRARGGRCCRSWRPPSGTSGRAC